MLEIATSLGYRESARVHHAQNAGKRTYSRLASHPDEAGRPERNRAAVIKPETNRIVLDQFRSTTT